MLAFPLLDARRADDVVRIRADLRRHALDEEAEKQTIGAFLKPATSPYFLLVCNKLLTGFDAKYLNTLYVDKNLKHHGLIQAFSRSFASVARTFRAPATTWDQRLDRVVTEREVRWFG